MLLNSPLYTTLLLGAFSFALLLPSPFSHADEKTSKIKSYQINYPPNLQATLANALENQGSDYKPRTEHLDDQGAAQFTNRLILESSPYLLQHAHNPVNWHSWSSEALEKAKAENKPIFLSIGYSTCHWCHVMEKESFENLEIASYLNQHFISIKIDREQRPDIDNTYMIAAALLSGQTGWPLNTLNTSEGAPFYAATYFPPTQFLELLKRAQQLWTTEQAALVKEGQQIISSINKIQENSDSPTKITTETYAAAIEQWLDIFDEFEGGFGTAPKFPQEPTLLFMLDQAERNQDILLLESITKTLDAMQQGGIYDQIAGGFHRYATDPSWLIPHFEKMLYNQAQLAKVYLTAYKITGDPLYKRTTVDTLDYTLREMRNKQGLFYSATDADSEGKEGRFFIWSDDELKALLTPDAYKLATVFFGLSEGPNFDGKNILHQPISIPDFVIKHQLNSSEFFTTLSNVKQALLNARQQRIKPHLDDKIITAWNSILIQSLAEAGQQLNEPRYLNAATVAANALWSNHYSSDRLIRDSRLTTIGSLGNLEDYSTFAMANLTLFQITEDPKWLQRASDLGTELIDLFWDDASSTLYLTEASDLLLVRSRSHADQATPAAESTAYELLKQLSTNHSNQKFSSIADQLLAAKSGKVSSRPMNYSYLLMAHVQSSGALDSIQVNAHGALRAELTRQSDTYNLTIELQPGWHINAQHPGDKRLVGSSLYADWIDTINYPEPHTLDVSFIDKPINLYSNKIQFIIKSKDAGKPLKSPLRFSYQACSDKQCLAPETLLFSPNIGDSSLP